MLGAEVKQTIQQAYSRFLEARGLRPRHGQKLMIAAIANTFGGIDFDDDGVRTSDRHLCVVEAGTGTGKTLAYLLATLPVAQALGKQVVLSTATVALQEQIVHKDLPEVIRHAALPVRFALAKGRGRYLCLSKLDHLLHAAEHQPTLALYPDEQPTLDAAAREQHKTWMDALAAGDWDGDRDNWPELIDDGTWRTVTTDHRQCSGRRCPHIKQCPFFRARDSLDGVDLIVTNHDLVLSDLALGGGAILPDPADTLYVFDEGHHLPDKARDHFAHNGRLRASLRWLDQLHKQLTPLQQALDGDRACARTLGALPAATAPLASALSELEPVVMAATGLDAGDDPVYRFPEGRLPETLREAADHLKATAAELAEALAAAVEAVSALLESDHPPLPRVDLENGYALLGNWLSRAEALLLLAAGLVAPDQPGTPPQARWVRRIDSGEPDLELWVSPILASHTLQGRLWQRCAGAVVTSATLTALGSFDRWQLRAGTPPESTLYDVVPSPFDYTRATLRIPPQAADGGRAAEHTQALIDGLPQLLDPALASLVLFASRKQMWAVFEGLPGHWQQRILLQDQYAKQALLTEHRRRIDAGEGSVIFGLASFAEGIDLPGDYCRAVVIAKLPFAVPDDPVEAALAEWVEANGGNAFREISVPDCALKLVQACGRLLRTEQDTGTIHILDRRLIARGYGKQMLASLPPFTRHFD